jgi:predicted SAM-dependent methyltransferase
MLSKIKGFRFRQRKKEWLSEIIKDHYDLNNEKFFSFGAGNQRSKFDYWKYVDMPTSGYQDEGIDYFYDLEDLKEFPDEINDATVIFSSFLLEHVSIEATRNFIQQSCSALKSGGIWHAKVHDYDYSLRLMRNGVIPIKFPFGIREYRSKVKEAMNNRSNVAIRAGQVIIGGEVYDAHDAFLAHNAACFDRSKKSDLDGIGDEEIWQFLNNNIEVDKRKPHQHNADYVSADIIKKMCLEAGFSEVYSVAPYQSISPALWEDVLNPIHDGFYFGVEAIK